MPDIYEDPPMTPALQAEMLSVEIASCAAECARRADRFTVFDLALIREARDTLNAVLGE